MLVCVHVLRRHPHVEFYALPNGRTLLTRSNIHEVAVRRQSDVVRFVASLLHSSLVTADLVYTFFHPLYRDVHIADVDDDVQPLGELA